MLPTFHSCRRVFFFVFLLGSTSNIIMHPFRPTYACENWAYSSTYLNYQKINSCLYTRTPYTYLSEFMHIVLTLMVLGRKWIVVWYLPKYLPAIVWAWNYCWSRCKVQTCIVKWTSWSWVNYCKDAVKYKLNVAMHAHCAFYKVHRMYIRHNVWC